MVIWNRSSVVEDAGVSQYWRRGQQWDSLSEPVTAFLLAARKSSGCEGVSSLHSQSGSCPGYRDVKGYHLYPAHHGHVLGDVKGYRPYPALRDMSRGQGCEGVTDNITQGFSGWLLLFPPQKVWIEAKNMSMFHHDLPTVPLDAQLGEPGNQTNLPAHALICSDICVWPPPHAPGLATHITSVYLIRGEFDTMTAQSCALWERRSGISMNTLHGCRSCVANPLLWFVVDLSSCARGFLVFTPLSWIRTFNL